MNLRIKQLAAQAGFDVERLLAPYPGGFPREDMLALESFAELIIAECISACATNRLGKTASVEELIKQHFGVEQ